MENKTCGECRYYSPNRYCLLHEAPRKPSWGGYSCFAKPTNGGKVRQAANKELAHMFANPCPPGLEKKCRGNDRVECESCWLDWLDEEAKDGE